MCSSISGFFYSTSFWYNSCVFIHSHCCLYSFVGIDQYLYIPFPDDEHLSAIQMRLLQTALLLTLLSISSVQFSSVAQSCLTLCNSMECSMPGLPVHHQLLELAQTQVHRVSDAIQPSHSLLSPSPAINLSQHQVLFK